jgi:hypothetical protein
MLKCAGRLLATSAFAILVGSSGSAADLHLPAKAAPRYAQQRSSFEARKLLFEQFFQWFERARATLVSVVQLSLFVTRKLLQHYRHFSDVLDALGESASGEIVLRNSQNAMRSISRRKTKQATIAGSAPRSAAGVTGKFIA